MIKILKYIFGFIALLTFFLVIDPSGVGFKEHLATIGRWARGEDKRLRFAVAEKR